MRAMADIYSGQLVTTKEVEPIVSRSIHNRESKILYNGDFSGDVQISVPVARVAVEEYVNDPKTVTVSVPFEDLRNLVLEYLLQKEITKLQEYSYDEFESHLTGV
jgi:hypothetical protein